LNVIVMMNAMVVVMDKGVAATQGANKSIDQPP
jgi:hypothetical protein